MLGDAPIQSRGLACMALDGPARSRVNSEFMTCSREPLRRRLTGAQEARAILDARVLKEVDMVSTGSVPSDLHDPLEKVLQLCKRAIAMCPTTATGIVVHEAGLVIRHIVAMCAG